MRVSKKLMARRFPRFVLVGIANTAFNFLVLNLAFYALDQSKLVSSFIATSCAMLFSFALNRHFVFGDKAEPARKILRFIAVTAVGVLLMQNGIYALCIHLLQKTGAADFWVINLSNVVASLGVMLWNYNGYRLLVFKDAKEASGKGPEPATERA